MEFYDFGVPVAVAVPPGAISAKIADADHAAQSDLRNALTAEKTLYTDDQMYSTDAPTLKQIEPSLAWGTKLPVAIADADGEPAQVVCMSERSASGTTFAIADIATGLVCRDLLRQDRVPGGGQRADRLHDGDELVGGVGPSGRSNGAGYDRTRGNRVAVGRLGCSSPLLPGRSRARRARSRRGQARASTRSPRSKPTVTRRSRWRCSGTRPISVSSRSVPTSPGCNASRTSCSPRRCEPVYSYVSLTEQSEYGATEDDERARLAREEGVTGDELETRLAVWRDRIAHYRENRLHPQLPHEADDAASTRCRSDGRPTRTGSSSPFDARKELMAGHARVGRTYAGRVLQLITGSTGIDDWEWGVTLLADDPAALKEIVYEMRFDPGVGALRRVRPVLHRPRARPGRRRARASGCAWAMAPDDRATTRSGCSCRSRRSSSTGR